MNKGFSPKRSRRILDRFGTIDIKKRTDKSDASSGDRRFAFTVPLVKLGEGTSVYVLEIPERVSSGIGRRGPVPILATLNEAVEIQASLVPMGGGKHRLQLNARTRDELDIKPGDRVDVVLVVPDKPPIFPLPSDLALALKEVDLQEIFAGLPVGKQNHIILWIEEAARPQTREKRVAKAIEVAFRVRERAHDKRNRRSRSSRRSL